jgi:hypothetical protein
MKWLKGGAARFSKTMGVDKPGKKFWVSLDISKFDQSVLAGLLMVTLFLPWFMYDLKGENGEVVKNLLVWSLTNSVAKVVKWFGKEWRVLFGLMFSGELMTSLGDSWYLEIIFDCFDQHIYRSLPESEREGFARSYRRFKDYGDDGVMSYHMKYMRSVCSYDDKSPDVLRDYLLQYWRMELKMEDTYVVHDDLPRPDMDLPSFYTQLTTSLNPFKEIEYRGPKFLKRYIIRHNFGYGVEDAPFRPSTDYFSKAICIAGNNQSVPVHVMRLRALALDTYGTNPRAYEFLRACHDSLLSLPQSVGVIPIVNELINKLMIDEDMELSVEDRNLLSRIGGPSACKYMISGFPTLQMIGDRTAQDDEYTSLHRWSWRERQYKTAEELMFQRPIDDN